MTERQWLGGDAPAAMLAHLVAAAEPGREPPRRFGGGLLPPRLLRKLRLFACAACRLSGVWGRLDDPRAKAAVAAAEGYADGAVAAAELAAAGRAATAAWWQRRDEAAAVCYGLASYAGIVNAEYAAEVLCRPAGRDRVTAATAVGNAAVAGLLHEVFGNPFARVALPRPCLTPLVVGMARVVYDDMAWGDLPILADALEDAGCPTPETCPDCGGTRTPAEKPCGTCGNTGQVGAPVLTHLRAQRRHARGCWALDLVLGR